VFAVLPALALALIAVRVRRSLPAGVDTPPPVVSADCGDQAVPPPPLRAYRTVLARPGWRLAVTGVLMYQVPFACVVAFGAVLAETLYGERPAAVELAFAVFFTASLLSRAVLAWRSPVRRKLPLFWLSAAATVVGLALLATGREPALLLVAMAVLGIPHGLTFPLALALSAAGVPRTELAWANAALMSVNSLAAVVTPGLLGVVAAMTGYRDMVAACLVPVLAFTAGFDAPGAADEREQAARLARATGARHESIEVTEKMVWQHLPEIVAAMDDGVRVWRARDFSPVQRIAALEEVAGQRVDDPARVVGTGLDIDVVIGH